MSERACTGPEPLSSDPRAERFGYICHRCLKCCHHKTIRVNPYEVARLARNRGLTTTEFRKAWTVNGEGLTLAQRENGACVFLGSDGCTVYSDRPLVCRLYPLGRQLTPDGVESFHYTDLHPQPGGEFTGRGTIADFLAAQDIGSFIRASDDYYAWLCAAYDLLFQMNGADTADPPAGEDTANTLLDMDGAISRHCTATRTVEPSDVEARRELHLSLLYQYLEQQQEKHHENACQQQREVT